MPVWRKVTEQTDWWEKQPVACTSEDLKCWGAWNTTCRHKAKNITLLIPWRRQALKEEVFNDLPWKYQRGPLSNKPWNYLKSTLKETWEMGRSTYRFSQHIDTILNWSALNTPLNRGQGCSSVSWTSVTVHCWCRFNSLVQWGTLLPE